MGQENISGLGWRARDSGAGRGILIAEGRNADSRGADFLGAVTCHPMMSPTFAPLHRPQAGLHFCTQGQHAVLPLPQKLKLELTWKTAETMANAMKATNEKATMSTEAEIVCESVPSQRSSSAR